MFGSNSKRALIAAMVVLVGVIYAGRRVVRAQETAASPPAQTQAPLLLEQTQQDVDAKSAGCVSCHTSTDQPTMHPDATVRLGCTDCHGGDAGVRKPEGAQVGTPLYKDAETHAHPQPKFAQNARSSANPLRAYTAWLKEDWNYIRFVNPGDLRVVESTCGRAGCHVNEARNVQSSMMTHGAMLWGAALYNNGSFPLKDAHFGESYGPDGLPRTLRTFPPPTPEETRTKGVLPLLEPLARCSQ